MKISIICSKPFGLRTTEYLIKNRFTGGIATAAVDGNVLNKLRKLSSENNLRLIRLDKDNLENSFIEWINKSKPDAVFVFSFPFKIPDFILDLPSYGFINFHLSELPKYRGSDPLFWQLKNGEQDTAVTAYHMTPDLNTGPVIRVEKEKIDEFDNYGMVAEKLSFKLMHCSSYVISTLLLEDIKDIISHQSESEATFFTKPAEKDLLIDWNNMSAGEIRNLVKASNPYYNGAITFLRNRKIRIMEVVVENYYRESEPGTVIENGSDDLLVAASSNKMLRVNVMYVNQGIISGRIFKKLYKVNYGEKMKVRL